MENLEKNVLSVHQFLFPVIFSLLLKYIYRKYIEKNKIFIVFTVRNYVNACDLEAFLFMLVKVA